MASKPEKSEYKEYARRLLEIRQALKINQSVIKKEVGCSLASWQEYETAKSAPNAKVLEALVEKGFNANWILSGKGEMKLDDEPISLSSVDNKKALKKVVKALWTEVEESDANLSPSGAAGIVALAYEEYLASNKDDLKLFDKIKALVQIADMGED